MVNKLTVLDVEANEKRLIVDFKCQGQIRKFITRDKFIVEYDKPIETVPESLLIVPFLATVAPIAYAVEADVYVPTIDDAFLASLGIIRDKLQQFYPKMNFRGKGDIHAERITSPHVKNSGKRLTLFSGGVDSITTFLRHRTEKPILVSIKDEGFSEKREKTDTPMNLNFKSIAEFSRMTKTESRHIFSNWIFIPNHFMLRSFNSKLGDGWWVRVMHGLSFAGLCAPLAYIEGADTLYIASSHTADFQIPWGSHPEIDNNIKWSGTKVIHEGYELSRQEKMQILADYINTQHPDLQVYTCAVSVGENCSQCEKCCRTIMGFELAGIDPTKHGYTLTSKTFSHIKKMLETHAWSFRDDWIDLQNHAEDVEVMPHPEAKALADWLQTLDLEALRVISAKHRRGDSLLKMLPYPLFKAAEKFYKAAEKF